jgi:hypothetical protein
MILYGRGLFCNFRALHGHEVSAVFMLSVNNEAAYAGKCVKLSSRFNNGHGNISPRNCYERGQLRNCRINHLIYCSAVAGISIE